MRYALLVLLNAPTILMALSNAITQHKLGKVSSERFRHQLVLWLVLLIVLAGSFPIYNYLNDKPLLKSEDLSLLDIAQTTVLVYLIYIINNHRRKLEQNERTIRDLHQEISIILSRKDDKG